MHVAPTRLAAIYPHTHTRTISFRVSGILPHNMQMQETDRDEPVKPGEFIIILYIYTSTTNIIIIIKYISTTNRTILSFFFFPPNEMNNISITPITDNSFPLWQRTIFGIIFIPLSLFTLVLAVPIVLVVKIVLDDTTYTRILNNLSSKVEKHSNGSNNTESTVTVLRQKKKVRIVDPTLDDNNKDKKELMMNVDVNVDEFVLVDTRTNIN